MVADGAVLAPDQSMWIALGILLVVLWIALEMFAEIASFAVHLLLIAAVIAVAVHFVRKFRGHREAAAH